MLIWHWTSSCHKWWSYLLYCKNVNYYHLHYGRTKEVRVIRSIYPSLQLSWLEQWVPATAINISAGSVLFEDGRIVIFQNLHRILPFSEFHSTRNLDVSSRRLSLVVYFYFHSIISFNLHTIHSFKMADKNRGLNNVVRRWCSVCAVGYLKSRLG